MIDHRDASVYRLCVRAAEELANPRSRSIATYDTGILCVSTILESKYDLFVGDDADVFEASLVLGMINFFIFQALAEQNVSSLSGTDD